MGKREVYDPKNPELEFHNVRPPRVHKPARKKTIFATKGFMIGYGIFLTASVILISMYKNGSFKLNPFFNNLLSGNKTAEIKIQKIDYYDNTLDATIEIKNINYTNNYRVNTLKANVALYNNKNLIYKNEYVYDDVNFPKGERIGFKINLKKEDWAQSDRLSINLIFDDNINITNVIKIKK